MHEKEIIIDGIPLEEAKNVLIMLHGRGSSANDILGIADHLDLDNFAIMAPQATHSTWYPKSFMAPVQENEPWLLSALTNLKEIEEELIRQGFTSENIFFFGFSQGACLTLEYITRNAKKYGGAVAIIGGLIGNKIAPKNYTTSFEGTKIFIGTSNPDVHVPLERVEETVKILREKDAEVRLEIYNGFGHGINQEEIKIAKEILAPQAP